jgi:hypothetical protein
MASSFAEQILKLRRQNWKYLNFLLNLTSLPTSQMISERASLWRKDPRETDEKGNVLMTVPYIKLLCKEQKLYSTPSLNDKLYLHFKGFNKIQNLDVYTGLKTIWLEGNGLSKIEGLDECVEMRCL